MPDFDKTNFINVGRGGTFRASGQHVSTPADIDALFNRLEAVPDDALAVHFHGGLVDEEAGMAIARNMFSLYQDCAQPVTFVWETGLRETVVSNLESIHKTKLFGKLVFWVVRQAAKRLIDPVGKGSEADISDDSIRTELSKEVPFPTGLPVGSRGGRGGGGAIAEGDLEELQDEITAELHIEMSDDKEIDDILIKEAPSTQLLSATLKNQRDPDSKGVELLTLAKFVAPIVIRVIRRRNQDRDHGFYPTVIEETLREAYLADVGEWVWQSMKEQAERIWEPNDLPVGQDSHPGRYFLEKLQVDLAKNSSRRVHLIGHSAGSIAICHLLRTLSSDFESPIKFASVSFLAPAATVALFHAEVVAHPERYERFRMFTMSDELERKDALMKFVYPLSLLYFISGVLEDTADELICGLEKQNMGQRPYDSDSSKTTAEFLRDEQSKRLVLSETTDSPVGFNSASHTHGGFDDDTLTLESLKTLVTGMA